MVTSLPERDVTTQHSETAAQPLTALSEDERLFRDSVYEFADREIRPLVREMDEHAKIPPALIEKLFDLGVMGSRFPTYTAAAARPSFTRCSRSMRCSAGAATTRSGAICRRWLSIRSAPTRCRRPARAAMRSRWRRAPWKVT